MSLLEVSGISKRFGGLLAVSGLSFSLEPGEILGLIGPNGSGKSTTMALVMGIVPPDEGSIRLNGHELRGLPPHRVAKQGLSIMFQHSRPLHRHTVLDNIKLALLPDALWNLFTHPHWEDRARALAERVGLGDVLLHTPETLPFAHLRRLELAKAIARDPRVVLIDEPFAGLTLPEMHEFSSLIASLRDEQRAVLLVDHNVKGVRALVDRVLAMHVGSKIAEGSPDEVMNDPTVRSVYLGGSLDEHPLEAQEAVAGDAGPLLDVRSVSVRYDRAQALDNVSLNVREGEFVSVVGLNGAGKTTLFNAISGFVPYQGELRWDGSSLAGSTPGAVARGGIVQCPESRELFGDMTVAENMELGGHALSRSDFAAQQERLLRLFPVLAERSRQTARTLSGGEQQMLAIARALMTRPRLLILDEPSLGLAPLVLEHISTAIEALRAEGMTVLLGEQNVNFALRHSDRVYLLEHGRVEWQGPPGEFAAATGDRYL